MRLLISNALNLLLAELLDELLKAVGGEGVVVLELLGEVLVLEVEVLSADDAALAVALDVRGEHLHGHGLDVVVLGENGVLMEEAVLAEARSRKLALDVDQGTKHLGGIDGVGDV